MTIDERARKILAIVRNPDTIHDSQVEMAVAELRAVENQLIEGSDIQALLARLEAAEVLAVEASHDDLCIRNRNEAGEPTEDGGYRMKFAGQWYRSSPVDETPKCNCGLQEKYEAWRKAAGK